MIKCVKCKNEKPEDVYKVQKKSGEKILKKCFDCREKMRLYKLKNKERISNYNKFYNKTKKQGKDIKVLYGRKKGAVVWIKYASQRDAAKKLDLHFANINKVLSGKLKTTGGYVFKTKTEKYEEDVDSWEKIKKDNNIVDNVKGNPSGHRKLHKEVNGKMGKNCSKCKKWNPLSKYNNCKNHWDKLRVQCIDCIVKYRKDNRSKISKKYTIYEKERKKNDPNFKEMKKLRSRLGSAIDSIRSSVMKYDSLNLTGCTLKELKTYIESQFNEDMLWSNHGKWEVDHKIPCSAFDLTDQIQRIVCFNWRNLQPLWKNDNKKKCTKHKKEDVKKLWNSVVKEPF